MFLKLVSLFIALPFLGALSQRVRGSSNNAYNFGLLIPQNSNGYSINNNKPSAVSYSGGSWGSDFSSSGEKPKEKPLPENLNWDYETSSNFDKTFNWNSNKQGKKSGDWQSDFNVRQSEKKLSSITNLPSLSKWNSNSNIFVSSINKDNNKSPSSSWGLNSSKLLSGHSNNQNLKPGNGEPNHPKQSKANENFTEFDYENNSVYPLENSNNKKNTNPTSSSYGASENWESSNQKNNKSPGISKSNSKKNIKQQKGSEFNKWGSNNAPQPGREVTLGSSNAQNEKKINLDTSILDELDKNDWYFGKESNYPKPPFRSTSTIDVSELWSFDKSKKSKQNNRGSNNNNNNNNNYNYNINRRNRQIERLEKTNTDFKCECVNVNFCEEEDMIISQKDVTLDSRPLAEFRCKKLTDVCCIKPKIDVPSGMNFKEEKKLLTCGQRRINKNMSDDSEEDIAKPGEFPWTLKLENTEINCSASLIHPTLALTAAHCVTGILPEQLTLKAGIWNAYNEPPQTRNITNIIVHPDYSSRNPRNDIALLILETPFELTDNVNTICLPVTNDKWDSNQCVVIGWRLHEIQGQYLEVLEKGVVSFMPQVECQNIMLITDLWRNYILHDSFVCGLEKSGKKSCTGEEGGFVICPLKEYPDTYLQIGIISKGMNCDNFGRPGIFTNVFKFIDWINKNYLELGFFDETGIRRL